MGWLVFLVLASSDTAHLPSLAEIFLKCQSDKLANALPGDTRVQLDLQPLLFDRGTLSRDQVLMSFGKLCERYEIREAEISNAQSDTNYAWLEVYLEVVMVERVTGFTYYATFAFHYKIIGAQVAISRWVLQDVR